MELEDLNDILSFAGKLMANNVLEYPNTGFDLALISSCIKREGSNTNSTISFVSIVVNTLEKKNQ